MLHFDVYNTYCHVLIIVNTHTTISTSEWMNMSNYSYATLEWHAIWIDKGLLLKALLGNFIDFFSWKIGVWITPIYWAAQLSFRKIFDRSSVFFSSIPKFQRLTSKPIMKLPLFFIFPKIPSCIHIIERFTLMFSIFIIFIVAYFAYLIVYATPYTIHSGNGSRGCNNNNNNKLTLQIYNNNNNWGRLKPSAGAIKWWLHVCLCNVQTTITTQHLRFCLITKEKKMI